MDKIKKMMDVIKQFDYIVKVVKAAIAGFETFTNELNKSLEVDNEK